jgi:hypothetical protein
MTCTSPIDASVLADYWLAALPPPEEDLVEEHLLSCDACGDVLREVIALAGAIREIARQGSLRMVVSEGFLQCAAREGLRIREYAPPPGGGVQCTVTPDDDLLVGRLAADFSAAERVDLSICDGSGVEQHRMSDIPVHPGMSSVAFQESITMAKAAPSNRVIMRLVARDESGAERLLGEYTFNHTRTMPGPAAW